MKTVRDVMCPVLDVLHTTDSVADAAGYLASHEEESVPFCLADGRLAGTVSNRDPKVGTACIIEKRIRETLAEGFPTTRFLRPGDELVIYLRVGDSSVAGALHHTIVPDQMASRGVDSPVGVVPAGTH